jgi:flagellar protein FlgJ
MNLGDMNLGPAFDRAALAADAAGFAELRRAARDDDPDALRETAQQFEALFVQRMLKEMRSASIGGGLFDSSRMEMYEQMFDQQVALDLSRRGGLGIADQLVRQLGRAGADSATQGSGNEALRIDGSPAAPRPLRLDAPADEALPVPGRRLDLLPAEPPAPPPASAAQSAPSAPIAAGPAKRAAAFDSAENFVDRMMPLARRAAARLGVPAEGIVAQAALETGWGQHVMHRPDGTPAWNLFGIKAGGDWNGDTVTARSVEVRDGEIVTETSRFRAYGSPAEAVEDYLRLIGRSGRYQAVLASGDDVGTFARELQRAGYATDPEYAAKIQRVAERLTGQADA